VKKILYTAAILVAAFVFVSASCEAATKTVPVTEVKLDIAPNWFG